MLFLFNFIVYPFNPPLPKNVCKTELYGYTSDAGEGGEEERRTGDEVFLMSQTALFPGGLFNVQ